MKSRNKYSAGAGRKKCSLSASRMIVFQDTLTCISNRDEDCHFCGDSMLLPFVN